MYIPQETQEALQAWRNGDPSKLDPFTWALVQNDLIGTIEQATLAHLAVLKIIVKSVTNELLFGPWGSEEKCKAWAAQHGHVFPSMKPVPILTSETALPAYTKHMLKKWGEGDLGVGTPWANILSNDLLGAVEHSGMQDLVALPATIRFMRENLPPESYGSDKSFRDWGDKFRRHFWLDREDHSSYCMMCEAAYDEELDDTVCPGEPSGTDRRDT